MEKKCQKKTIDKLANMVKSYQNKKKNADCIRWSLNDIKHKQ